MSEPEKNVGAQPRHLPTFWKLLRPRMLLRYLFCLACLATVIALFYAEEDLRGKYSWESFMRKSKAKGLDLDWRANLPPPVPDDQNFAMTPPFAGFFDYERTPTKTVWRDTNIWVRMDRFVFPTVGQPPHSPPESELGGWVHGRPLDLKKWQDYFRASITNRVHTNRPTLTSHAWPLPSQPHTPANDVLSALSMLNPELEALRKASSRTQSRFPIHYEEIEDALLPHLSFLRNVSRVLQLRSVAELAVGDSQQAFADVNLAFACADAVKSEPFSISQIVLRRILEGDLQPIWEGLSAQRWSKDQLESFQRYFSAMDLLTKYEEVSKTELAFTCAWIDSLSAEPGSLYLNKEQSFSDYQWDYINPISPRGWYYQNELTAARFFRDDLLPDVATQSQRAFPGASRTNAERFKRISFTAYTYAFKFLGSVLSPQEFVRTQTEINLALVACALERFRMAQGRFPDKLDALAPVFLEKLPHDIMNGQPLKYRLTEDGRFVLYSVGWNQIDDGGTVPNPLKTDSLRERSSYRSETGDWVWEYPRKE
ncbi:MAG: hypothetical protein ACLQVY_14240 [Limisphaerales bacterium]